MRKSLLFIMTILLTFAFVACTNDNLPQTSDDSQGSSVSSSDKLPDSSVSSSEENSEWGDIDFPRP